MTSKQIPVLASCERQFSLVLPLVGLLALLFQGCAKKELESSFEVPEPTYTVQVSMDTNLFVLNAGVNNISGRPYFEDKPQIRSRGFMLGDMPAGTVNVMEGNPTIDKVHRLAPGKPALDIRLLWIFPSFADSGQVFGAGGAYSQEYILPGEYPFEPTIEIISGQPDPVLEFPIIQPVINYVDEFGTAFTSLRLDQVGSRFQIINTREVMHNGEPMIEASIGFVCLVWAPEESQSDPNYLEPPILSARQMEGFGVILLPKSGS